MQVYQDLLRRILTTGWPRADRTGVGTVGVFGHQMRFDLAHGFPLLTTKKLHTKSIIVELLWFLSGSCNVRDIHKHNVTIWDEWADKDTGDLGPIYGEMWRSWPRKFPAGRTRGIDQIADVVHALKINPDSRRHIVTAWNPEFIEDAALPPCHVLFQFNSRVADFQSTERTRTLDLHLYQRSADCFLGVPFNIASYALLLILVAHVTDHQPGEFIHTLGDAHLYVNHLEQARLQLTRTPRRLPRITVNPNVTDLFQVQYEDVVLTDYDPHPAIKADVAV